MTKPTESNRNNKESKVSHHDSRSEDGNDSDSDVDIAFASIDFAGVDFDLNEDEINNDNRNNTIRQWEEQMAFQDYTWATEESVEVAGDEEKLEAYEAIRRTGQWMANGDYIHVLSPLVDNEENKIASRLFSSNSAGGDIEPNAAKFLHKRVQSLLDASSFSEATFLQLELLAVASLNLFCQANYTGPTLEEEKCYSLAQINPHVGSIKDILQQNSRESHSDNTDGADEDDLDPENSVDSTQRRSVRPFQNAILTELAVDGEWPCPVCDYPYFLLLARTVLEALNSHASSGDFKGVHLWHARSLVAHLRLLQTKIGEAPAAITQSLDAALIQCTQAFTANVDADNILSNQRAATVWLERGLAEHHMDRIQQGRDSFQKAQVCSGLEMEVTGSMGKRTKFQQDAKAQMLVRAQSKAALPNQVMKKHETDSGNADGGTTSHASLVDSNKNTGVSQIKMEHPEDGILLERVHYSDDKENEIHHLNTLDQCILLALCLHVQSTNAPARQDVLTAEEMGAFLARVLDHHDDWMIYSTALLERSWIEFERSHAKERAMLQMQALCDQHSNRLTLTQSTQKSVTEDSAPVQERLQNLHALVYPPRWGMQQEIADRYASIGMVTSAAELYTDIELFDEVVECYTRAGKRNMAEAIVRERLKIHETPRMWTSLGELTNDPECYRKAIDLSKRRFAKAFIALAQHYFDKGELSCAAENYNEALKIRPLMPHIWFRVGTIAMRLEDWGAALRAFSEVVQQEPEEAEAWANVAAVHLHNKNPSEAYPALNESLRHQRNNWRVWVSKLYTCLDLSKWDEAIQAANVILDLRLERAQSEGVPPLEEKCIRAIVGGAVGDLRQSQQNSSKQTQTSDTHEASVESARRTLLRCHGLLDRIGSASSTMPWVFECLAFLHESVGADDKVLEYLTQEYRTLQGITGWEREPDLRQKMCSVVSNIVSLRKLEGSKDSLVKSRMLVRGVKKKIESTSIDPNHIPPEAELLGALLAEIEAMLDEKS